MIIEMKKRKYTLKRRAAKQQETRERIVDAAMALHEELGPAATTISALAERAGLQRLTVYRHFSNDEELFGACSTKWLGQHPPPDLTQMDDANPLKRTRAFLLALYRYYEGTERMWTSVYRDVDTLPALRAPMAQFDGYLASAARQLARALSPKPSTRLRATLAHAVKFSTWRSLAEQGLGDLAKTETVCAWIKALSARG